MGTSYHVSAASAACSCNCAELHYDATAINRGQAIYKGHPVLAARGEADLTQTGLADALGVSFQQVQLTAYQLECCISFRSRSKYRCDIFSMSERRKKVR